MDLIALDFFLNKFFICLLLLSCMNLYIALILLDNKNICTEIHMCFYT